MGSDLSRLKTLVVVDGEDGCHVKPATRVFWNRRELLDRMGQQVRSRWVRAYRMHRMRFEDRESSYGLGSMPRWDGGVDAAGVRRQPIWPRIAEYGLCNGVSPLDMVQAFFNGQKNDDSPVPSMVLCPGALGKGRELQGSKMAEMKERLDRENLYYFFYIRQQQDLYNWPREIAAKLVLLSPEFTLSTVYRYCRARLERYTQVADTLWEQALLTYLCARSAYDFAWNKFLPGDLRQEAERLSQVLSDAGRQPTG